MKRVIVFLTALLLMLSVFSMTGCGGADSGAAELITNGDFIKRDEGGAPILDEASGKYEKAVDEEGVPTGWSIFSHEMKRTAALSSLYAQYTVESEAGAEGAQGRNYIRAYHYSACWSMLYQTVKVSKNTVYEFSFDYLIVRVTENTGHTATNSEKGVGLHAAVLQDNSYIYDSRRVESEDGWDTYRAYFDSGAYTELTLAVRLGAEFGYAGGIDNGNFQGTAHYTNVSFKKYDGERKLSTHKIGSARNLVSAGDFVERELSGVPVTVPEADGLGNSYAFDASAWDVETIGTAAYKGGTWSFNASYSYRGRQVPYVELTLKEAYISFTQRVNVKKNTVYKISYLYWMPTKTGGEYGPLRTKEQIKGQAVGLHATFKQDAYFTGGKGAFINSAKGSNSSATNWTLVTEYINTGDLGAIDVGFAVGTPSAHEISGTIRVANFTIREYDKPALPAGIEQYVLTSYTGDGSRSAGSWWIAGLLTAATLLLSVFALYLLTIRGKKAEVGNGELVVGCEGQSNGTMLNEDEAEESCSVGSAVTPPNEGKDVLTETVVEEQMAEAAAGDDISDKGDNDPNLSSVICHLSSDGNPVFKRCCAATARFLTNSWVIIALIAFAAVAVRIVIAGAVRGFRPDVSNFADAIVNSLHKYSFREFYAAQEVVYRNPPLYLYVMKLISLVYGGASSVSASFIILMKLPLILCDIVTAFVLYLFARKYAGQKTAYVLFLLYAFNPAVFVNSAMWGQTDSFAVMFIVLALYCLLERKYALVFLFYTLAVASKQTALFIAPALAAFFVYQIVKSAVGLRAARGTEQTVPQRLIDSKYRAVWTVPVYLVGSFMLFWLICLPFSVGQANVVAYPFKHFLIDFINASNVFGDNMFNVFGLFK
ncbi:MAG: glycosyltransferase family 39 protein, partial [Firmicutes bacterium]|nr:glycosyltransferase family 39 protein [Bacillota bacterium]